MRRWAYLLLFVLGLSVQLVVATFQTIPGYLDADYYFMGGKQLAEGKGFTEPFIWIYLDNPTGIPHPSHGYWMPLASMIAALGMLVAGETSYAAGRLGFMLLAALAPPLTARLAKDFTDNPALSWTSGLLAVFPVFHTAFLPVPDNYGIYMVAGALYFLAAKRTRPGFWLGLLAGVFTLARSDGLLWLAITLVLLLMRERDNARGFPYLLREGVLALTGFFLVMGPWYARNIGVYGAPMSPGNSRALWLTNYDETFTYPASKLTMQSWLASGWAGILRARLWALGNNIQTMIAAQGALILFPFILTGMWIRRKDRRVQIGFIAWIALLVILTLFFPFAGARGSFFHAGAALQPLFWSLAPIGLEAGVDWARRHGRFTQQAHIVFRIAMLQIVFMLSAWVVWVRVIKPGWQEGELKYPAVESFLLQQGISEGEPVIVLSAPGYTMMTGRPALAQPAGGPDAVLAVAQRYDAHYFAFEASAKMEAVRSLYDNPEKFPEFHYLGEVDETRIFRIP